MSSAWLTGAEAQGKLLGRRWPLIPCGLNKKPMAAWKGAAYGQFAAVRAPLWAVLTGEGIGAVVLDFDGTTGAELCRQWEFDPHVRTGSGGLHVYVTHPGQGVPNSAGRIPGLDIRGDGGIAHLIGQSVKGVYEILRPLVPTQLDLIPDKIKPLLEPKARKGDGVGARPYEGAGGGTIGALAYLDRACESVRHAVEGTRNATLNRVVYSAAGLVAGGELSESAARAELTVAAASWGVDDWRGVLAAAWASGTQAPWRLGPCLVRSEEW